MTKPRINLKGTEKIDIENREINDDDKSKKCEKSILDINQKNENVKTQVIPAKKVIQIIETYGTVNILAIEGSQIPLYSITPIQGGIGLGKISQLLEDDMLEEIMHVPGKTIKVVHRKHGMCDTTLTLTPEDANNIVKKVADGVNKKIDFQNPLLDARLPDGSRVNATVPPASPDGTTFTIRKFLKDPMTIVDLINTGTINSRLAALLWMWVEGLNYKPANILVAGGTASGKTTTLNVLAMFIPESKRMITIEDTAELRLNHEHWIRLEAVPPTEKGKEVTMDMLLKNTLRMRPDRIIVGEVRGEEAKTMFTAMNTGHDGVLGTVHANTAMETITRLTNAPMNVPPVMLTALDIIIMQQKMSIGERSVRRINEICEISGLERDTPRLNPIFKWDPASNILRETGVPSKLREQISRAAGITIAQFDQIAKHRQQILESLVASNIRDANSVCKVIKDYYLNYRIK